MSSSTWHTALGVCLQECLCWLARNGPLYNACLACYLEGHKIHSQLPQLMLVSALFCCSCMPAGCTQQQLPAQTACCCCVAGATCTARRWQMRLALRATGMAAGSGTQRQAACPQAATSMGQCLWARGCTSRAEQ